MLSLLFQVSSGLTFCLSQGCSSLDSLAEGSDDRSVLQPKAYTRECERYGEHPSVQIHLNKSERGKQIGRVAYRMACEQSGYDKVYAHMHKSNHASRKEAEEAGFVAPDDKRTQLTMLWQHKPGKT